MRVAARRQRQAGQQRGRARPCGRRRRPRNGASGCGAGCAAWDSACGSTSTTAVGGRVQKAVVDRRTSAIRRGGRATAAARRARGSRRWCAGAPRPLRPRLAATRGCVLLMIQAPGPWPSCSSSASGTGPGREVAGGHLGVHLHPRVGRDQLVGDVHALADLDARAGDRVVLHVAHRHQAVDLARCPASAARRASAPGSACPARRPRTRCAAKYWSARVAAHLALARVVDQELGHLAERAAFLAASRTTRPTPPRCAPRMHSSIACVR